MYVRALSWSRLQVRLPEYQGGIEGSQVPVRRRLQVRPCVRVQGRLDAGFRA